MDGPNRSCSTSSSSSSLAPPRPSLGSADGPNRIRRLDPCVVQRIAAGEVVLRPASALKELLENSIDAGSTVISVTIHEGGFKVLSVSDNGCGIHPDDLPILCRRFTTSKLRSLADLRCMYTFGFRGEALASLSVVGNVEVNSRVSDLPHGFLCKYDKGELVSSARPSSTFSSSAAASPPNAPLLHPGLQLSARDRGTTFRVTQLLSSFPERKKMLGTPHEEYSKCLDICRKYALDNPHIQFVCKRQDKTEAELSTPGYRFSSSSSSSSSSEDESLRNRKAAEQSTEPAREGSSKGACEEERKDGGGEGVLKDGGPCGGVLSSSSSHSPSAGGRDSPCIDTELERLKEASRKDGRALLVITKAYGSSISKGLMEIDVRVALPRAAWRFAPACIRANLSAKTQNSSSNGEGRAAASGKGGEEEEDEGEEEGNSGGKKSSGERREGEEEGGDELEEVGEALETTPEDKSCALPSGKEEAGNDSLARSGEKEGQRQDRKRQKLPGKEQGDRVVDESEAQTNRPCEVKVWGYASKSSAGQKPPGAFLIFVNNRLVECALLR